MPVTELVEQRTAQRSNRDNHANKASKSSAAVYPESAMIEPQVSTGLSASPILGSRNKKRKKLNPIHIPFTRKNNRKMSQARKKGSPKAKDSPNGTVVLERKHNRIVARTSFDDDVDSDELSRRMCIVSLHSSFCVVWDTTIFVCVAWIAVVMPFQIAFHSDLTLWWNSKAVVFVDLLIDLLFWADVFVSFRTSYLDYSGDEILHPLAIAKHYAAGYFATDLVSCLPGFPVNTEEMLERLNADDDTLTNWDAAFELAKLGKTSKLLRTARLVKAIRLIKIKKISAYLEDRYNIDISRFRVFGLLFLAILLGHLFSCFFIFCSGNPFDETARYLYSWERTAGVVDADAATTYVHAFYWAMVRPPATSLCAFVCFFAPPRAVSSRFPDPKHTFFLFVCLCTCVRVACALLACLHATGHHDHRRLRRHQRRDNVGDGVLHRGHGVRRDILWLHDRQHLQPRQQQEPERPPLHRKDERDSGLRWGAAGAKGIAPPHDVLLQKLLFHKDGPRRERDPEQPAAGLAQGNAPAPRSGHVGQLAVLQESGRRCDDRPAARAQADSLRSRGHPDRSGHRRVRDVFPGCRPNGTSVASSDSLRAPRAVPHLCYPLLLLLLLLSCCQAIVSRRSHELVGELRAVTSFNEIAMLRPLFGIKSVYPTTIVAKSDCDLYCLSNTDMLQALSHAPRVIQNIMEGAVDKYMHILRKRAPTHAKYVPCCFWLPVSTIARIDVWQELPQLRRSYVC